MLDVIVMPVLVSSNPSALPMYPTIMVEMTVGIPGSLNLSSTFMTIESVSSVAAYPVMMSTVSGMSPA